MIPKYNVDILYFTKIRLTEPPLLDFNETIASHSMKVKYLDMTLDSKLK